MPADPAYSFERRVQAKKRALQERILFKLILDSTGPQLNETAGQKSTLDHDQSRRLKTLNGRDRLDVTMGISADPRTHQIIFPWRAFHR
jgi:hypothetical protein